MKQTMAIGMALLLSVLGCGGGGDDDGDSNGDGSALPPYSGSFSPCGGDVVGQWQITETAVNESVIRPLRSCPDATATWTRFQFAGTLAFGADGTVVSTGTIDQGMQWEVPAACVASTCADFAAGVTGSMQEDLEPGDTGSFVCSDTGSGCSCELSVSYGEQTDTDTYAVAGSRLTITEPEGDVAEYDFCVTGDTLVMRDETMTMTLIRS